MIPNQKFPPQKVIAVDVDGTLQIRNKPNEKLIEWLRTKKDEGFFIMLWSSRGAEHAQRYAELFNVVDLFNLICSKPGYIVDDKGWQWVKYTKIIRQFNEETDQENENNTFDY